MNMHITTLVSRIQIGAVLGNWNGFPATHRTVECIVTTMLDTSVKRINRKAVNAAAALVHRCCLVSH